MLLKLLHFELKYQFNKTAYWVFTLLFLFCGIFFAIQDGAIQPTNQYSIHLFTSLISLVAVFQIAFQTAQTVLRDSINNATQLIHTTSIRKYEFLASRFLGIFITSTCSTLIYVFAIYFTISLDPFSIHLVEALSLKSFLWPWVIIVLPNVFIVTCILFSIALITKKSPYVLVSGLLIILLFLMNNFYIGSPFTGGKLVVAENIIQKAALFDMLGLCSSYEQTQFWTPLEKQQQLIGFLGTLLWNRLLWLSVAIGIALFGYSFFSFRISQNKKQNHFFNRVFVFKSQKESKPVISKTYMPVLSVKNSLISKVKEFTTLIFVDFKGSIFSRLFIWVMIIWCVMLFMAISHNLNGHEIYGNVLPTTGLLVGLILEPLAHMGLFLIVFYAGEITWKSRHYKFNEILDTLPTRNTILISSKYAALFLLPILMIVTGIGIALLFQLLNDYSSIDYSLYVSIFYYGGLSLFIYGIITVFVQQLVHNKYVGMLLSLVVIYGLGYTLPMFGITHPLANIFQLPKVAEGYSEFMGFGTIVNVFNWMTITWIPLALLLLVMSFKVYKRTSEKTLKNQLRLIITNWNAPQRVWVFILLALCLVSATTVNKKYKQRKPITELIKTNYRANYEKTFSNYKNKAIPTIIDVKTWVSLSPKDLSYKVTGHYIMKNVYKEPIDTLLITSKEILKEFTIENARVIQSDTSFLDSKLLVFQPALAPEQTAKMTFMVEKKVAAFENQRIIQKNGTYLQNTDFEPRLGYQDAIELVSVSQRIQHGLPEKKDKQPNNSLRDIVLPKQSFETWVTTDSDQIAISIGDLIDKRVNDDRVTYHYKSSEKTDNNLSYFSAKYDVETIQHKGVSIEVYHLPTHNKNVSEIIKAASTTLDYGVENFGSYPFKHLRIAEVPLHWKFGGHSLAGTIAFQERFFTQDLTQLEKGINQLSRIVAHEIGHEWFGHKMCPARGLGANMLNESMANYVEGQILEKMYGLPMLRRLSNFNRRRYFNFRSSADIEEVSLYKVHNETHIAYRKGFVTMQAVKDLMGEDQLNCILKEFIEANKKDQSATSEGLVNKLIQNAETNNKQLIKDWFTRVIRYDLSIHDVTTKELNNGTFEITIDVQSKRFQLNTTSGVEKQIKINENLSLGFYEKDPDDDSANPIFKKIKLTGNEQEFAFILNKLPNYVVLDPLFIRLDNNIEDNVFVLNN